MKKETAGRQGKEEGQTAHTRDAKLGSVFTQATWDEEGYAIRHPDSTTYVAAIETAEEFGKRLYLQAWKCGSSRAQKKVVMGDSAEWIWNMPLNTSRAPFRSSISSTPLNIYGNWRGNCTPTRRLNRDAG